MHQEKPPSHQSSLNRSKRALSQNDPSFLRGVRTQLTVAGKSSARLSGLEINGLLRTWENVSKINYYFSTGNLESDRQGSRQSSMQSLHRRNLGLQQTEQSTDNPMSAMKYDQSREDALLTEQFPINVTSLMNEENLWGCFYNFPELLGDAYSPVVRVRDLKNVPEITGGVLTRDVISACLTYLKRIPILGDYVFIKLDLSSKHLVNIEVLQHYRYLVFVDLSSNYLTELTVLSHLLYLQFLSVSYNRLSTVLEYEVPQWFLTEVHYKYNSVKRIRDLTMFWSITILDLSHNNIKCISGLENLAYLRRLDLSFNHIQRLENLNNLRLLWLDLSYNNISSFEFGPSTGLWTLYHLEYLNLNENNLTSMKLFSGCTRLQELHARNNRLSMLLELAVYMRQMRRLIVLDLRANPVCSTPGYKEVVVNTFPILLNLDAEELDPVEQRQLKMDVAPDVNMFASRRLLRLLYIEQLTRAGVSRFTPPADTTEIPIIVFVGYQAVGKGTLARRLATECSSNVELALQHTTAAHHSLGHYKEVSRSRFDDMLLAGDFLTYHEMQGDSYGLSREEAYVRDGKVRVACLDLTSALMLKLRGLRPYLILTCCLDTVLMKKRQQERKVGRQRHSEDKTSIEVPLEKSTLQVLVSGRILVTGILNEILMTLPEEKEQSEFLIESQCSLLMESNARQAVQEYAKGINMLQLLCSTSSLDNACNKFRPQNETSLCSLYKESQGGTDEYASDLGRNSSIQEGSKKSNVDARQRVADKTSDVSRPKSIDFRMSAANSAKSSKSVTFTSQDAETSAIATSKEGGARDSLNRNLTGLVIEPEQQNEKEDPKDVQEYPKPTSVHEENVSEAKGVCLDRSKWKWSLPTPPGKRRDSIKPRSLSRKFPWTMTGHPPPGHTASSCSFDDGDLWLTFLVETGLLQASDPNMEPSTADTLPRHTTRIDDPDYILRQLAIYRTIPSQTFTTNIRDDYEDIHRKCPGVFWDTITMDDPEAAFKKAKKIIKAIVESQKNLKPMFDIDFAKMDKECPFIKQKVESIAKFINQGKIF